ncbi:MAG TPA: metalloregulator ArsR/SmtB family transcription factor [Dehalococcoidia bacterium]|nr:metalloregulator ArsR/SmtB family transcription factor [Dehalococcoidia bacterium]
MESTKALRALAALAQDTRLALFRRLVKAGSAGLAAGRLAEALGVPPATLSFHLKELAHADLVAARQEGRFLIYTANYATMNALLAYLTQNCCADSPGACATPACTPRAAAARRAPTSAHRTKRIQRSRA